MSNQEVGRRRRGERGSQIVEFALISPVLVFMAMMALDGGRMLMTYAALKNSAREAAIYAAKNNVDSSTTGYAATIGDVVQTESNGFLQSSRVTAVSIVDVTPSGGFQTIRDVTVTYQFQLVNPVLTSPIFGGGATGSQNVNMSVTFGWTVN